MGVTIYSEVSYMRDTWVALALVWELFGCVYVLPGGFEDLPSPGYEILR